MKTKLYSKDEKMYLIGTFVFFALFISFATLIVLTTYSVYVVA